MNDPQERTVRRIQRVRHELVRRDVEVVRVERISPHFAAITFHGETLASFVSDSFDDHVKFMFQDSSGDWIRRDYTPRHFDRRACEITLEFALHGHGLASEWARQARPGQRATIGGPRGSMIIPDDYAWQLLVGDASALPAIHRRLEELPATAPAIVVLQIADAADRRALHSAGPLRLLWVHTGDELVEAVRALELPAGEGFAWCAGEAATMARLRIVLLQEKQQPKEAMKVAAYWKPGASDFHETLDL